MPHNPTLSRQLTQLDAQLGHNFQLLEQRFKTFTQLNLKKNNDVVKKAASHLLALPGKRLRPLCVLLTAHLGGYEYDQRVSDLALACELLHCATLLHDDIIDNAERRRGQLSAHLLYSNAASILGGDYLLIESLKLVKQANCPRLLTSFLSTLEQMIQAEALQLSTRGKLILDEEHYLRIVRGKTAALFTWSLEAGATLAKLPPKTLKHLRAIGEHLGIAFQVIDDLLDLTGTSKQLGKKTLMDLQEGKITLPLILGAQRSPELRRLLKDYLKTMPTKNPAKNLKPLQKLLTSAPAMQEALQATQKFAADLRQTAAKHLAQLPPHKAQEGLALLLTLAIKRTY